MRHLSKPAQLDDVLNANPKSCTVVGLKTRNKHSGTISKLTTEQYPEYISTASHCSAWKNSSDKSLVHPMDHNLPLV